MIKILVDSSADYTLEEAKKQNIEIIPISIEIEGTTYKDCYDITRDEFYKLLTTSKSFPKTSQPSPDSFLTIFNEAKENGDTVICLFISSALSGTYQCAHLAKNMSEYDDIHIIDSLGVTYMIKLLADYTINLANEGLDAKNIVTKVESLRDRVTVFAAVDTLDYLCKGGRLSKSAAAIGELANLKPIVSVDDEGRVIVVKKCIGKNKAIHSLLDYLNEHKPDTDFPLYSIYTYDTTNSEKFQKKLEEKGIDFIPNNQVGSAIGAHIGPGAFGVIYISQEA